MKKIQNAACATGFELTPAKSADGKRGLLLAIVCQGRKTQMRCILPDPLLIDLLQKIPLAMASHKETQQ